MVQTHRYQFQSSVFHLLRLVQYKLNYLLSTAVHYSFYLNSLITNHIYISILPFPHPPILPCYTPTHQPIPNLLPRNSEGLHRGTSQSFTTFGRGPKGSFLYLGYISIPSQGQANKIHLFSGVKDGLHCQRSHRLSLPPTWLPHSQGLVRTWRECLVVKSTNCS